MLPYNTTRHWLTHNSIKNDTHTHTPQPPLPLLPSPNTPNPTTTPTPSPQYDYVMYERAPNKCKLANWKLSQTKKSYAARFDFNRACFLSMFLSLHSICYVLKNRVVKCINFTSFLLVYLGGRSSVGSRRFLLTIFFDFMMDVASRSITEWSRVINSDQERSHRDEILSR